MPSGASIACAASKTACSPSAITAPRVKSTHAILKSTLTAAAAYREHSQAFVNLSMHEQRLYRVSTNATKTLEDLKAKRTAGRQAALDTTVAFHNMNKMLGEPSQLAANGFRQQVHAA
jgi:hypothetical protein